MGDTDKIYTPNLNFTSDISFQLVQQCKVDKDSELPVSTQPEPVPATIKFYGTSSTIVNPEFVSVQYVSDNTANIDASRVNSPKLQINKPLEISDGTNTQVIFNKMTEKKSGETVPAGVEFSGDAQFNINVSGSNVKVRISELYDPNANIGNLTNVVSSICRRIYNMENNSLIPIEEKDSSTGAVTAIHLRCGGEIQDKTGNHNGDANWIRYFASLNLDSGDPPTVYDKDGEPHKST